jgi:uncharacterized protein (DUF1800 family)
MQDGIDLITAVVSHPATARRLVTRLWNYFVSEINPPPDELVNELAEAYLANNYSIRVVMRRLLRSADFRSEANYFTKYSWPSEFVAGPREVGRSGFGDDAVGQMVNMGQVFRAAGRAAGSRGGWISTGGMLARMNLRRN